MNKVERWSAPLGRSASPFLELLMPDYKMSRPIQERAAAAIEGCTLADSVPKYVMDFYERAQLVTKHIHNTPEFGQHVAGPVIAIAIENMKLHERITALEARMDELAPVAGDKKKQEQKPAVVGAPKVNAGAARQPVGA